MSSSFRLSTAGALVVLVALVLDTLLLGSFRFITFGPDLFAYRASDAAIAAWNERAAREVAEPARTEALTLIIVDGLRLDVSRTLPALNALRARGREAALVAPFPSFTRVGYGSILSGAPPQVHGYVSNGFEHPAPIVSIAERARAAGFRTRFIGAGGMSVSWIPKMFPAGIEEALGTNAALEYPPIEPPFLDIVYDPQPDDTGHERGGTSEDYRAEARAVDRAVGGLLARLDLERGAVIVVTDHGHIDPGGHGGHEDSVLRIPCIVAGRGSERAVLADGEPLEAVARVAARLIGVPPPPDVGRHEAWLDGPGGAARGAAVRAPFVLVLALAVAYVVRRCDRRGAALALLALGVFHVLYAARGHPFSFSIVNDPRQIPLFAGEVVVLGALALLAARILGPTPAFLPAALATAVAYAAATAAIAGPTATTAIHAPGAAYLYQLALAYAVAVGTACGAGTVGAALARLKSRRKKSVPCSPTTTP